MTEIDRERDRDRAQKKKNQELREQQQCSKGNTSESVTVTWTSLVAPASFTLSFLPYRSKHGLRLIHVKTTSCGERER